MMKAMSIMAMFIHNEPTSLAMVQEASLPQVFYKLIEAGLEPVIELSTISPHQLTSSFSSSKLLNAIGGLCLDYDLLTSHPSITPGIILIFTSESHIKVLHEKGNAVVMGPAIDKLIHHHPTLKTTILMLSSLL
jgi:E3 ubiquitin-protein ligase HUWE1